MKFTRQLAEQIAVTFLSGFAVALPATGGNLDRSALMAGAIGGLRALYGLWAKSRGADQSKPSVL